MHTKIFVVTPTFIDHIHQFKAITSILRYCIAGKFGGELNLAV